VHVSVWGGGAEPHREEFSRAESRPGAKAGLTPPILQTAVREGILCWVFFGILWEAFCPRICNDKAGLWVIFSSLTALTPAFKVNQAPLSNPVPTEVVAPGAGTRDPLKGDRDLRLPLPKTPGLQGTGQHPGQIAALCLQDPQPQAPMSHPLSENIHLHLHLYLLGLWQENPSQGMSHHLCRESLPWLLPKTQTPQMSDPPLQGERAPALDRDPDPFPLPFLETPCPREGLALQPLSLYAPHGHHQLAPNPGETGFPSPESLFIWFFWNFLVLLYVFFGFLYFFPLSFY